MPELTMFCYIEPFQLDSTVYSVKKTGESEAIFSGKIDNISAFMATEYKDKGYNQIILAGIYAESIGQDIREYSMTNYNMDNINIKIAK